MDSMNAHSILPRRGEADFDLFPYVPSAPAAWAFVVLFAISAVVHFVLMIMFRSWYFIPFILGCAGESAGYYGRAWAHQNIRLGTPFLIQMMLILGSAPLLAATVYMTLGRLVRSLDAEEYSIIRSTWVSKIYILIDIASFGCQMFGSAAQASGPEGAAQGMKVIKIGLGVQLGAFAVFLLMAVLLHVRLIRGPTVVSERPHVHWRRHVWTLYAVSVLIIVRSLFRLVEFAQGPDGTIVNTEALMYVFDAALLWAATVAFAVVHPGMLFRTIQKNEGASWSNIDEGHMPLNQYAK
ncbi:RTA1-domain-containing protein [Plenodomus tracheiphilus IPT5]|uniref:RTA1-domain-containing protein n=1 Tax=Plenodomus tracheiphilus IPT5 TaxID=1408161 RepID=A0A6A7BDF5_9PLEO|nr:RTA1-domain-containing protein [Plenodomus tracheiphilus IPT5]